LGEFGGDNAYYLLMARHFSPYSPKSAIAAEFATSSFYPPLFPLLLGLTGGGESLLAAHLVTTVFLLIAFGLFYWWLRLENISLPTAVAALITLAAIPGIYFQTLSVHSENLFMLCSIIALACAIRAKKEKKVWWMALTVLAIAAAYFTRTAAISLIAAWLIWLWVNRMPHRVLFGALATLPVLVWSMAGNSQSNSYLLQLVNGYRNPATFLDQVEMQGLYLFQGWATNFGVGISAYAVAAIFLAIGLIAALARIYFRQLDGYYILLYLGMSMIWPFPSEAQRLSLIALPVLLIQTIWMLNQWQLSTLNIRPWGWTAFALIAAPALPELALNAQRYLSPLPVGVPVAYRHAEWWYSPTPGVAAEKIRTMAVLESGMRQLKLAVPEKECIYAIKPSLVAFLADRVGKAPPSWKTSQAELERKITTGGCRYVFMMIYTSPSYPIPLYPYQRIPDKLEAIQPVFLSESEDGSIVGLLAKLR